MSSTRSEIQNEDGQEKSKRDASFSVKGRRPNRLVRRIFILGLLSIAGLYGLSMTSKAPTNLGVANGRLTSCPESPNCVSTQATDKTHRIEPVPFMGDNFEAIKKIKQVVADKFSRAKLIEESDSYLRYEFTSLIFRFVDDVEFFVNDKESLIHFRSAARVGHSDLGSNRRRMQTIYEELTE